MKVFVYYDLHHQCWSLRSLKTGRVLNFRRTPDGRQKVRRQTVALRDCQFRVSQAGRRRVLASGRKNVHAGVVGTLTCLAPADRQALTRRVSYNPQRLPDAPEDWFRLVASGEPIFAAPLVLLERGKVFVT